MFPMIVHTKSVIIFNFKIYFKNLYNVVFNRKRISNFANLLGRAGCGAKGTKDWAYGLFIHVDGVLLNDGI